MIFASRHQMSFTVFGWFQLDSIQCADGSFVISHVGSLPQGTQTPGQIRCLYVSISFASLFALILMSLSCVCRLFK